MNTRIHVDEALEVAIEFAEIMLQNKKDKEFWDDGFKVKKSTTLLDGINNQVERMHDYAPEIYYYQEAFEVFSKYYTSLFEVLREFGEQMDEDNVCWLAGETLLHEALDEYGHWTLDKLVNLKAA